MINSLTTSNRVFPRLACLTGRNSGLCFVSTFGDLSPYVPTNISRLNATQELFVFNVLFKETSIFVKLHTRGVQNHKYSINPLLTFFKNFFLFWKKFLHTLIMSSLVGGEGGFGLINLRRHRPFLAVLCPWFTHYV